MSFRAFFGAVAGIWRPAVFLLPFIVLLFHGTARATPVPPGLMPGDTYQFVFVTQDGIDATSPSLSTYNNFAQAQALQNSALTGASATFFYHAIVATMNEPNAQINAGVGVNAKVYLLVGNILVDTGAGDFWDGNHLANISYNQFGTQQVNGTDLAHNIGLYSAQYSFIWSGCTSATGVGCAGSGLLGHPITSLMGIGPYAFNGFDGAGGADWFSNNYDRLENDLVGIYAISDVITVPGATPLPSTWLMLLSGFVGLGWFAYRGTKKRTAFAAT